jgi:hypothetical protein
MPAYPAVDPAKEMVRRLGLVRGTDPVPAQDRENWEVQGQAPVVLRDTREWDRALEESAYLRDGRLSYTGCTCRVPQPLMRVTETCNFAGEKRIVRKMGT